KRTFKFLTGSLAILGCFMGFYRAEAQSWNNGSGTIYDGWTVNNDNSNNWAWLRLQTYNNRAWTMVNEDDLWWGYAANSNYGDRGTEKMRLTTGGKLGIGTTSPAEKLHVSGGRIRLDGTSQTYLSVNETGSNAESRFWTHVDGELYIQNSNGIHFAGINNSSRYVSFLSNGNVGIGTTDPQNRLSVVSGEEDILHLSKSTNDAGDNIYLAFSHGNNTASSNVRARIGTNIKSGGEGRLTFHTGSAGTTPERMRIDENGNVGIGTVNPSASLHIGTSSSTSLAEKISFRNQDSYGIYGVSRGISSRGNTLEFKAYDYNFNAITTRELLTLRPEGNVGIGTVSPTEKLEVNGTVKATSFTSSAASFPDYVFAEDYRITPLSELEKYVKANRRLPGMPSEKEVVEKGLNLPEVLTKSVENIETIYLHLIRMEKKIEALEQENAALKQQLKQGR
ncbi:MAG: hypothetical protein KDD04_07660, partial [Sinomicrobium sp.]|nr:hypothetical protein [Sinomicrobium sp.]